MKNDDKKCCGDCKKGNPGQNHACHARLVLKQLEAQPSKQEVNK